MSHFISKFSTPVPIVREARVDDSQRELSRDEPLAALDDDHVFPHEIVVDAEAYADLEYHIKNPRKPGPALLAMFKR